MTRMFRLSTWRWLLKAFDFGKLHQGGIEKEGGREPQFFWKRSNQAWNWGRL